MNDFDHEYRGRKVRVSMGRTMWRWSYSHEGGEYQNKTTHKFEYSADELRQMVVTEIESSIDSEG